MSKLKSLGRRTRLVEEGGRPLLAATAALGRALIEQHVPAKVRKRLLAEGRYGLMILVPTAQHAEIIAEAFEAMIPTDRQVVVVEDQQTLYDANTLLGALGEGKKAISISTTIGGIPTSFRSMADEFVPIPGPDISTLRRTLRHALGKYVRLPSDMTVHAHPELLCRCIVAGMPTRKIVSALAKLGEMKTGEEEEPLPPLAECIEFGEAQAWGMAVMKDLEDWQAGRIPAADIDATCLLTGPPGVGKTRFARTLAQALKAPLLELTIGTSFRGQGYLGDVLKSIRRQFAKATETVPTVLLLDELDSFSRRDAMDHNQSFNAAVINELLTQLDGATTRRPGLVIVAATNLPDAIDPAIRRPGRISRTIEMSLPDETGVEHILRVHLRGELSDEPLDDVVRLATGSTAAELMDLVRLARQTARHGKRKLAKADLLAHLQESDEDPAMIRRIAVHEAGHGLACLLMPDAPVLHKMTIRTAGASLGKVFTSERPGAATRSTTEATIMMYLAGRAAENIAYGADDVSDGANHDFTRATRLAARMHAQWGMGSTLTHFQDLEKRLLDADFAGKVEKDLQRLMRRVTRVLVKNQDHLMALATVLASRRVLTRPEALEIMQSVDDRSPPGRSMQPGWRERLAQSTTISTAGTPPA